jgi:hypothetical protein
MLSFFLAGCVFLGCLIWFGISSFFYVLGNGISADSAREWWKAVFWSFLLPIAGIIGSIWFVVS